MGFLRHFSKPYNILLGTVLATLLGAGIWFGTGYIRGVPQPQQNISSSVSYTTHGKEDIRKIAARYGLPPSVVMTDNNMTSFAIEQGKELTISPVKDFRRIPKNIGRNLYGKIRSDLLYEDAFVSDMPFIGDPNTLETVVLFSRPYSHDTSAGITRNGKEFEQYMTRTQSLLTFVILNAKGKKVYETEQSWTYTGRNNTMYPLGPSKEGYGFLVHTDMPQDWFPWQIRDLEHVVVLEIKQGKNLSISTLASRVGVSDLDGRSVRIEDTNGDGNPEVIVDRWVVDTGNRDLSNVFKSTSEPFRLRRYEFRPGVGLESSYTNDFVVGELMRLFSSGNLSAEDIYTIVATSQQNEGPVKRTHIDAAVRILGIAQQRRTELMGIVADSISLDTDYTGQAAQLLGTSDPYIISQALNQSVFPYLFVPDNTGKLQPIEIGLYNRSSRIAGILPHERRIFAILDPEARQVALQGEAYIGKEDALGIQLRFSKSIDASSSPLNSSLVIVDKSNIIEGGKDIFQKARAGELTASEAFLYLNNTRLSLGVGLDLSQPVTNVANVINTASSVVDILRANGIDNIGDVKRLMSGDFREVQKIPGFRDALDQLFGEKKK